LSQQEIDPVTQTYRIGAVSRLTGIPADTLRVWERRYHVVEPIRTASGTRLYAPEDVGRLSLIKQLVDRGDAISSVAGLSLEQLQDRVRASALPAQERMPDRPCRVVVLGSALAERMRQEAEDLQGVELVGAFADRDRFVVEAPALRADVAILDYPTIHADQVRDIARLTVDAGASRALVIYRFAAASAIERLGARRVAARRGPVEAKELRRWCLLAAADTREAPSSLGAEIGVDLSRPIPQPRFSEAALARIATVSTTVRCECPHHLVDLISGLSAFEAYSEECEIRNQEDAALHAFLHRATAQARVLMEVALARVIEVEGLGADGSISGD
jgi:DNA-binding transcriptional MerR regulator